MNTATNTTASPADSADQADPAFTPCLFNNKFAYDLISDEHEKLQALAYALRDRLEPADPRKLDDCDITSWRLIEVMIDMLESNGIHSSVKNLLWGEPYPKHL